MHLNWGGLYGTLYRVIQYSLISNQCCKAWMNVQKSVQVHSTEEVYESRREIFHENFVVEICKTTYFCLKKALKNTL